MTRLEYWIHAQTQYRVHSPFIFDMYRKVLFARLSKVVRKEVCSNVTDWRDRQYHEIVYKLRDHYHLTVESYDNDEAVLAGDPDTFGKVKVIRRPHICHARELRWQAQQDNTKYRVSIDLYDTGLLLNNPKLHPQKFLLK